MLMTHADFCEGDDDGGEEEGCGRHLNIFNKAFEATLQVWKKGSMPSWQEDKRILGTKIEVHDNHDEEGWCHINGCLLIYLRQEDQRLIGSKEKGFLYYKSIQTPSSRHLCHTTFHFLAVQCILLHCIWTYCKSLLHTSPRCSTYCIAPWAWAMAGVEATTSSLFLPHSI